MFRFMKTLNLLDECSTLRAHSPLMGFTGGSDGKQSAHNVRDRGSIPGSGCVPARGSWREQQGVIREPDLSGKIRRATSMVWGNNDRGGAGSWMTKGQEEEKRFMEPGTRGSNWRNGME